MEKIVRLCMFDMGGVVVKHSDSSLERLLLRDFGVSGHDSFASVNPSLRTLLEEHSRAQIDEQEMWSRFTHITGIAVPPHQDSLWGRHFKPELDEYVVAIIEELKAKGHRVVCATNTEEAHYAYHREQGQYDIFDAVYASLQLGEVKPERAFFDKILATEQLAPDETVFIDDLAENCEAAKAIGIRALLYDDPVALRWQLASMGLL